MHARCDNPKNKRYADYGGRGIRVCERWHNFVNFLTDMGERPIGKSLDRFPNNDGNYEPGNCRWASRIEQQNNMRSNVYIAVGSTKLTVAQAARSLGIDVSTIHARLRRGWTPKDAIKGPHPRQSCLLTFKGKTLNLGEWSKITGIDKRTLWRRFKLGWAPIEILAGRGLAGRRGKPDINPEIAELLSAACEPAAAAPNLRNEES
jgi:hypothetical protein